MKMRSDLTGQRFGRLVVESEAERRRQPSGKPVRFWRCRCDCGGVIEARLDHLKSGAVGSCGCLQQETRQKNGRDTRVHGLSHSPTYISWAAMIARCTDPRNISFKYYGARGIAICERWRESFESFLADMGERPAGMTLDRYPDNDGNYEPGNCRWATRLEQRHNRRKKEKF